MMRRRVAVFSVLVIAALGVYLYFRPVRPGNEVVGVAAARAVVIDETGAPFVKAAVFGRYADPESPADPARDNEIRLSTGEGGEVEIPFFTEGGRVLRDAWLENGERLGPRLGDGSAPNTITLARPAGTVEVTITSMEGSPIAGARVRYGDEDRVARTTDAAGVVRLPRTHPPSPDLWVTSPDGTTVEFPRAAREIEKDTAASRKTLVFRKPDAADDASENADVPVLRPTREVFGVVVDEHRRRVAGARVRVTEVLGLVDKAMSVGQNAAATFTNARGEFRVRVAFTGERRIVARFGVRRAEFEDSWRYAPKDGEPVILELE